MGWDWRPQDEQYIGALNRVWAEIGPPMFVLHYPDEGALCAHRVADTECVADAEWTVIWNQVDGSGMVAHDICGQHLALLIQDLHITRNEPES